MVTTRTHLALLAREYLGAIHKYSEALVADPRNVRVSPMCEDSNPDYKGHLREQVSNSYPGGGEWCLRCLAMPGEVRGPK